MWAIPFQLAAMACIIMGFSIMRPTAESTCVQIVLSYIASKLPEHPEKPFVQQTRSTPLSSLKYMEILSILALSKLLLQWS